MAKQNLTRREFLHLAAVASAGTALAACAPVAAPTAEPAAPAETEPAEAPAAPMEKEVELWTNSGGGFGERLEEITEEIREATGLHIQVAQGSGGWQGQMERVNTALAAGSVPGLVHIKDFSAWDYAWRGAVTSLDDYYASGDLDFGAFRPSMWDGMKYRDTAVGIPFRGSFVWVLFINDALFKEAGLDPAADAPTTWDELVDVSTKLTDPSAGTYGHSFYEWGTREVSLMLFSAYVGQVGGRIFTEDMSAVTLDTPEAEEALQWIVDMMYTWKVALPAEDMPTRYELAYNNLVGTMHTGLWFIDQIAENAPQTEWSLTKVPCLNTCDNADTPECLVIFNGAEDPDTAWQAAVALTQPEYDVELSALIGGLPIYVSSLSEGAWAEDPSFIKYGEIGRDPDLRPRYWIEGYEEVTAAVLPDLEAVWFGQQGVKEGLVAAEKAGNEALKEAHA